MHVDDFKAEPGDPRYEPGQGCLVGQPGTHSCRDGADADLAVVEF
jgi:hypothetical protein